MILRVLQCLSAAAKEAPEDSRLDVESIRKMLEFFREFADRCHHGKEEAHFFPLAHERGVGGTGKPQEPAGHETGRGHIRAMEKNLEEAEQETVKPRGISSVSRMRPGILTDHIGRKTIASSRPPSTLLSTADQEALVKAFEKVSSRDRALGRRASAGTG